MILDIKTEIVDDTYADPPAFSIYPTEVQTRIKVEPEDFPISEENFHQNASQAPENSQNVRQIPGSSENIPENVRQNGPFPENVRQNGPLPEMPRQTVPYILYEENMRRKYICRMCLKMCNSLHGFHRHVHKLHNSKCLNCKVEFKSWKHYEKHIPFCSRRFGICRVNRSPSSQNKRPKRLPFTCQLCARKYEKHQHLIDHQIKRCKKRYISDAWIVKI